MANKIAISLHDVGVSYRKKKGLFRQSEDFWPLRNISFDVYQGETLGIIGRNGVGKSTLLRLMAGIVEPCEGRVNLHGNSAALLALQAGFIPHLTGRENAMIGGMLLGMRKQAIESKINAIVEFSELEKFIDQPLQTYSSGMKLRLGFSVAIQAKADILLIDEVLAVGDEKFKIKCLDAIKKHTESGQTIIIVSHALAFLTNVCTKGVMINERMGVIKGDMPDIFEKYRNL